MRAASAAIIGASGASILASSVAAAASPQAQPPRISEAERQAAARAASPGRPVLGLDTELKNRGSLLPQVDAALGRRGPAAVEFILAAAVRGSDQVPWPRRLLGNPCGHAFVAYTLPTSGEGIEHVAPRCGGSR